MRVRINTYGAATYAEIWPDESAFKGKAAPFPDYSVRVDHVNADDPAAALEELARRKAEHAARTLASAARLTQAAHVVREMKGQNDG